MSKVMWQRDRKEQQKKKNGSETIKGVVTEGEIDRLPPLEPGSPSVLRKYHTDMDYLPKLARCDVLGEPAPKVPKAILIRLGLVADQKRALGYLRTQKEYRIEFEKATKELSRTPIRGRFKSCNS